MFRAPLQLRIQPKVVFGLILHQISIYSYLQFPFPTSAAKVFLESFNIHRTIVIPMEFKVPWALFRPFLAFACP